MAATQYILGIRPAYEGLRIDPCIPRSWGGFRVTRQFRNSTYEIEVRNPDHVCSGVTSVTVNGTQIPGNVVSVFGDGATHRVEVALGHGGEDH